MKAIVVRYNAPNQAADYAVINIAPKKGGNKAKLLKIIAGGSWSNTRKIESALNQYIPLMNVWQLKDQADDKVLMIEFYKNDPSRPGSYSCRKSAFIPANLALEVYNGLVSNEV